MNIPTEDDWRSEAWSLDTEWAYKHFFGKTLEEAVRLFETNSFIYDEDLMYMPVRVVGYYLRAYFAYMASSGEVDEPIDAGGFVRLIRFEAEHRPDVVTPLWPEIEPLLRRAAEARDVEGDDLDWVSHYGNRVVIQEIARRGFPLTFDPTPPETVPECVGAWEMASHLASVPLPIAAQVIRHAGLGSLDPDARKADVLRVLGPPTRSGGGEHPTIGTIPDWIVYEYPGFCVRVQFDGDTVTGVMFLRTDPSAVKIAGKIVDTAALRAAAERILAAEQTAERARAIAAWNALFHDSPGREGSQGGVGPEGQGG